MFKFKPYFLSFLSCGFFVIHAQPISGNTISKKNNKAKKEVRVSSRILDITLNNVGLSSTDTAVAIELKNGNSSRCTVITFSGRIFTNVSIIVGSSTGSPPNQEYTNFIGSYTPKKYSGVPGRDRRIIYCAGPCQSNKITNYFI